MRSLLPEDMQSLPIQSLDLVSTSPTPPRQCVRPEHDLNHTITAFNGKLFLVIIGFFYNYRSFFNQPLCAL